MTPDEPFVDQNTSDPQSWDRTFRTGTGLWDRTFGRTFGDRTFGDFRDFRGQTKSGLSGTDFRGQTFGDRRNNYHRTGLSGTSK
jgi:hypothetical protein